MTLILKKTLHVNNKGADQPSHPHSLVIAFVICFLGSFIVKHATVFSGLQIFFQDCRAEVTHGAKNGWYFSEMIGPSISN